jgi:AraC family transcriptional regulator
LPYSILLYVPQTSICAPNYVGRSVLPARRVLLYRSWKEGFLAKIAVELEPLQARHLQRVPERLAPRLVSRGDGWTVTDVVCNAGPRDRPFEEQHLHVCVAIVLAGSFQCRSTAGRAMLTPGSLFLGNAGQYFQCGHEHAVGDRCLSFSYEPQYFEALADEAGISSVRFSALRVPPLREFSSLVARACAALATVRGAERAQRNPSAEHQEQGAKSSAPRSASDPAPWEEIAVELASRALGFATARGASQAPLPAAEARVTRIVRMIEDHPDAHHSLDSLAQEARLSRYHFLRLFQQLVGLTPHQYVLRHRLRRAATRLMLESARVLDVGLDSGFGDVSNFNHGFRAEFGVSPRSYRRMAGR